MNVAKGTYEVELPQDHKKYLELEILLDNYAKAILRFYLFICLPLRSGFCKF